MSTKQSNNKKEKKKEIKSQNVKQNQESNVTLMGITDATTCSLFQRILFYLSLISTIILAYYTYFYLTTPPKLPEIDLKEYWGVYPMDPKPDVSIRPYKIEFSDVVVNDLRERLLHRRPFTPPLDDAGFTYGFNTNFLTRVLDYWQNKYDFKQRENFFNKYNHYITNIQGLDIHYMHVKPNVSSDIKILPLLLLHGWPGSIREFYEIIPKLTTPNPKYDFVFEVIAPSLPGFGFSQASTRPGLDTKAISVIISNLMERIGHKKYYVQGGDIGHSIGSILSTLFPDRVLGFHTNMPVVYHTLGTIYSILGSLWPSLIVEPELQDRMYPLTDHIMNLFEETGYLHIQATKPDTIGIALTDSPAGLTAYILEKFSTWTNPKYKIAGDGNLLNKFALTHLLDNVMVYWVTNTITPSMRLYAESLNKKSLQFNFDLVPTNVPTWGIKFKHELSFSPDCNLKLKYTNYLHTTAVEDGGHFASMENPDLMAKDIFEAVDTFISFHSSSKPKEATPKNANPKTIYDFTVKDINGNSIRLEKYKGNVLLIVNVATHCGLTDKNYKQLNKLHEKYSRKGLRILAFPCNQFGGQEPGTSRDIVEFTSKMGVEFDVFDKVSVNGDDAHPLWAFLKSAQSGTLFDAIKWNFSKFIVNRDGVPVERWGPTDDPSDLEPHLVKYL